jgi:hypothetical protein
MRLPLLVGVMFACALAASCDRDNSGRKDGGDGGSGDMFHQCVGLECQVNKNCAGGVRTTITGKVFAPNGTLPLYNATVFVPNTPLEPFTSGVTCDRCDGKVSGSPIATALTDATGSFALLDVPSGKDIPLVIQMGRWRRQVTLPTVEDCVTSALTDVTLQRLPKNQSEGDIPQMAIATGSADPFECLLLKIGIDPAEFSLPAQNGRVHYYRENGIDLQAGMAPAGSTLWTTGNTLARYDIVMLPCEGGANAKPAPGLSNLINYLDAGGRVFVTHYSYVWLTYAMSPFNVVGAWMPDQAYPSDGTIGTIDTSFPKGMAFSQWLQNVDASGAMGQISLDDPRHDIDSANPMYAQQWVTSQVGGSATPNALMHMTFNTPLSPGVDPDGKPLYCGRVVYSDFHVSASAADPAMKFPASCKNQPLSRQEKALAFMLFDLSSCVQADTETPIP